MVLHSWGGVVHGGDPLLPSVRCFKGPRTEVLFIPDAAHPGNALRSSRGVAARQLRRMGRSAPSRAFREFSLQGAAGPRTGDGSATRDMHESLLGPPGHRAPQTCWPRRQKRCPHCSGGWKSQVKVLTELFLLSPLSLTCRWSPSPWVSTSLSLWACL